MLQELGKLIKKLINRGTFPGQTQSNILWSRP